MKWNILFLTKLQQIQVVPEKKNTRKLINYLTFMMKKNIKKAKLWRNALDG